MQLDKFNAKLALNKFNAKSILNESSVDFIILLISNDSSINKNSKLDNLESSIELVDSIFINISSNSYLCNQPTISNKHRFYFKNQDDNSIDELANRSISKARYRVSFVSYIEPNKDLNK